MEGAFCDIFSPPCWKSLFCVWRHILALPALHASTCASDLSPLKKMAAQVPPFLPFKQWLHCESIGVRSWCGTSKGSANQTCKHTWQGWERLKKARGDHIPKQAHWQYCLGHSQGYTAAPFCPLWSMVPVAQAALSHSPLLKHHRSGQWHSPLRNRKEDEFGSGCRLLQNAEKTWGEEFRSPFWMLRWQWHWLHPSTHPTPTKNQLWNQTKLQLKQRNKKTIIKLIKGPFEHNQFQAPMKKSRSARVCACWWTRWVGPVSEKFLFFIPLIFTPESTFIW